jgi:hypothetical protein
MKKFIILIFLFSAIRPLAQNHLPVSQIDFVTIKDARKAEALYFYENNWKVYREMALKKGYIRSYNLLTTNADSPADFDIMLVTEYTDSTQYKGSETHFQQIIKELRPGGPKLLNELKPADFRINLYSKVAYSLFYGGL